MPGHCIRAGAIGLGPLVDLSRMKFYFNYSNSGCSNIPYPGTAQSKKDRYVLTGTELIDEGLGSDMAVLKLLQPIPPHFKPYYSGWSASAVVASNAKYFDIHHAGGDIKKISSANALLEGNFPPTRYHVFWTNGVTEEGSSGSGLFNLNRRLVGVLSSAGVLGFGTNCTAGLSASFGKFRNFWIANSDTRRALNPRGVFGLLGTWGGEIECYNGDLNLNGTYYPAGDYQPNNVITLKCAGDMYLAQPSAPLIIKSGAEFNFEAGGQIIVLRPGFEAENGSVVSIKPNVSCSPMRSANNVIDDDIDESIESIYYEEKKGELPKVKINAEQSAINVTPNPSLGIINIKIQKIMSGEILSLKIYDSKGQLLINTENISENTEINLSDYSEGVYMAQIISNLGTIIIKRIVLIH